MRIEYAGTTSKGGRLMNEDAFIMLEENKEYCFAVADGLGGHGKGDVASSTAVGAIIDVFPLKKLSQKDKISACFEETQKRVLEKQRSESSLKSMKTTLAVLHIQKGTAVIGHIGDTRIYGFRGEKIYLRTLDHSVPQMLVAIGNITENEIRGHEDRNRLLRVIGMEWAKPEYEIRQKTIGLSKNDKFLLCSDGFWENIEDEEMIDCLKKTSNANDWLEAMKAIVIRRGENKNSDNFTAVAVWVK